MGKRREALLEKLVGMQEKEIERLENREKGAASVHSASIYTPPAVNVLGDTSWEKAPIENVICMLLDNYAGRLSIYDFWGIGDEREVHLGGETDETVKFVLTDKAVYTLAATDEKCVFTVDQKNVLANTSHYMNENCTNKGGWEKCDMRRWLDAVYTKALPEGYGGVFKDFVIEDGIVDKFSLRSEVELFGKAIYGEDHGGRQIEWYKQTRNRIKLDGSDSAESRWYWERSPHSGNSNSFCRVFSDGSASGNYASGTGGIAPFGCI